MASLQRLFGAWTNDLAPGIPDQGTVVKNRILYRSGETEKPTKGKSSKDNDMAIEDKNKLKKAEQNKLTTRKPEKDSFQSPGFTKNDMALNVEPENASGKQDSGNQKEKLDIEGNQKELMSI